MTYHQIKVIATVEFTVERYGDDIAELTEYAEELAINKMRLGHVTPTKVTTEVIE